ncbi:tol-like protein [Colletotrichum kahawae]|uniref:Tol-like protein n=1 Tax=Colletotrichum kahawae TaxID=34407 RepID=A0AAD9Y9L1_COLKA|nr:tol-like protein [Colletotrichum kahawae]
MATEGPTDLVSYSAITQLLINPRKLGKPRKDYCDPFLPERRVQRLVQRARVEATLRDNIRSLSDSDLEKLTDYVMNEAKKVFLTLVRAGGVSEVYLKALRKHKFTDADLPIGLNDSDDNGICTVMTDGKPKTPNGQSLKLFSSWSYAVLEKFFEHQWIFLAPIFRKTKFEYHFDHQCSLPFVDLHDKQKVKGGFGAVRRLGLRIDYTDFLTFDKTSKNAKPYVEVAVKFLNSTSTADAEKFYGKEMGTLKLMRSLNDAHLIKAFAVYTKGDQRCFVFPWAEGGNLQDFWIRDRTQLSRELVTWAITQMYGISKAIGKLHGTKKEGTRHGDIKPLNILCFPDSENEFSWGNLVVADVGLAKVHHDYTSRREGTTTKHGTTMYEPPEMADFDLETTTISRRYDVWSLGCVFLEFTTWLLYGQSGLERFYRGLTASKIYRFWRQAPEGPTLHPVVGSLIDQIKKDAKNNSALWALVDLISSRLLIGIDEEHRMAGQPTKHTNRATAAKLVEKLEDTLNNGSKNGSYYFDSDTELVAEQRADPNLNPPTDQAVMPRSEQRTTKLDSVWRNIPDNSWGRTLTQRLDWSALRPAIESSRLCSPCKNTDFLSFRLDLGRSLGDLSHTSEECPMCYFLFHCLSKRSLNWDEMVKLSSSNDEHTFLSSINGAPAISLYFDPDSHSQIPTRAQLGLPLLPKPGSSQQFNLLGQWVQLCNTRHQCLQTNTRPSGQIPTRLLHVGTASEPSLHLIETRDEKVNGHYVALSHCWGVLNKEQRVCTYAGNIETFKQVIPFESLPSTFRDAVTVTRELGVSYLWIDSLCIIQEDNEDWKSEASKMEDVFSSAYCTIAASSSTSSLDGFLAKRVQRAAIGIQTSQGTLYLAEAIDDFETHVEKGVLNTRGWVLQERALSRRTIHFTSTQVYWECGEGVHCETLAELGNRQSMFLSDSNFPTYGLEHYKDERIRLVQYLYQVYSGLNRTKPYDRSKAILGLQKRLGSTFKSPAMYGVISAYFERTFLWQAGVPGSLTKIDYEAGSTVPSWSWMALMGKVRYIDIPFGGVTWTGDLETPFHAGFDDAKWDVRLVAKAKRLAVDDGVLQERCKVDVSSCKFEPNSWRCVVVGEGKVANQDGDIDQYVLLIRERSSSVTPPVYERVGVGILSQRHIALETTIVHIA